MKIAYIIERFNNSGGMERDLSLKTNWLVTKKAYDITIIAARQVKGNSYFQLSPKTKLVDLAVDFSKKGFSFLKMR